MRYIKKLAILSIALALTSTTMAATGTVAAPTGANSAASTSLEVKGAPVLVAKTNNSVTLEWNKVDTATSYIVKYSTKSVATSTEANPQYDNETDPVTSTGTVVANLTPNTDYYFSVVAVDKDNNESDTFSDELQVKTDVAAPVATTADANTAPVAIGAFAIKTVTAVDNKTVELEFSTALGTTPVTVKITKTSDNSDVPVASVTPDVANPTKATAKILTVLDPSSTYSLTVVTASDTAGNTIKQGVDGIKEFPTLANLPVSQDAAGLNAGGNDMSGTTAMSGATATPNLEAAKTGPQLSIIITLALLLSFATVLAYRKKFAK